MIDFSEYGTVFSCHCWCVTEAFYISMRPGRTKCFLNGEQKRLLDSSPGMKLLWSSVNWHLKEWERIFVLHKCFLFLEPHSLTLAYAAYYDSDTSFTVPCMKHVRKRSNCSPGFWTKMSVGLQGKYIISSVIKALGTEKDLSFGCLALATFYWVIF